MTTQTEALKLALEAYLCREMPAGTVIGDPKWWVPRIANAIKEALAQPEQERCVGCEACIDTACGRDECPKGWPKAAQPEQEPVAWMDARQPWDLYKNKPQFDAVPLYTTPPQRTWVGLTDKEKQACIRHVDELGKYAPQSVADDERLLIEAVEAKLMEKNA